MGTKGKMKTIIPWKQFPKDVPDEAEDDQLFYVLLRRPASPNGASVEIAYWRNETCHFEFASAGSETLPIERYAGGVLGFCQWDKGELHVFP